VPEKEETSSKLKEDIYFVGDFPEESYEEE